MTRIMGKRPALALRWPQQPLCAVPPTLATKPGSHPGVPCPSGLFEPSDMKYDFYQDRELDPSLVEMTEVAVHMLSRNPRGFYLFVEGEWGFLAQQSQAGKGHLERDRALHLCPLDLHRRPH